MKRTRQKKRVGRPHGPEDPSRGRRVNDSWIAVWVFIGDLLSRRKVVLGHPGLRPFQQQHSMSIGVRCFTLQQEPEAPF